MSLNTPAGIWAHSALVSDVKSGGLILVIGATGYVGSRLVLRLHVAGYKIRCLARNPEKLQNQPWRRHVEVVEGDVLKSETLQSAMSGVTVVYYLVHSMEKGADFHERDLTGAKNCAAAAKLRGVQRIIYLGGLGDPQKNLSDHLRSRQETGEALRKGGVPVTEFRAAVIVGSGSYSFELVRHLTERLPLMICPRWVSTKIQPVSIQNVLDYLLAALENPDSAGKIIEIGGVDVLTYGGLMKTYAKVRGLKRLWIPIPLLTPRLSSYWLRLVTPLPTSVARLLIEGLRSEVIVRDTLARDLFPKIQLLDCRGAVAFALARGEAEQLAARVPTPSRTASESQNVQTLITNEQGIIREARSIQVNAPAARVYSIVEKLGGKNGWPAANWAWKLRGYIDHLLGGPGLRRQKTTKLSVGDPLDFWRVESLDPGRLIRLRAEMKVPGKAWLQFQVRPCAENESELVQTAFFKPKGLTGLLYWYALLPAHWYIFKRLVTQLARQAEAAH